MCDTDKKFQLFQTKMVNKHRGVRVPQAGSPVQARGASGAVCWDSTALSGGRTRAEVPQLRVFHFALYIRDPALVQTC